MKYPSTSRSVIPAHSLPRQKRGAGIQAVAAAETISATVIPAKAGIQGRSEPGATRRAKPMDFRLQDDDCLPATRQ
jgi:hypothetical protein